jgi:signal transduction histidine kinase
MQGDVSSQSSAPRYASPMATLALAVVFGIVLLALALADHALVTFDARRAEGTAESVSRALGETLKVRSDEVRFLGQQLIEDAAPGARVRASGSAIGELRAARLVWIADATGHVRGIWPAIAPESGVARRPTQSELERLSRLAIAEPGGDRRAATGVVADAGGSRAWYLVEAIERDGTRIGLAGALFGADELLAPLAAWSGPDPTRLTVLVEGDTLGLVPMPGQGGAVDAATWRGARHAGVRVVAPGGEAWRVDLVSPGSRGPMRITIWGLGIGLLLALALVVAHERRQARRIAERSEDLERLSEDLLRANRVKNEFLAAVTHELRTPLNAIVGFADLLRDGAYGELAARQISPVQRIEASANHLRQLVDQMLDLAKMAAGRLEVHREILELRPFVLEVASEMEPLVSARGLSLQLSVGTTLPRVRTDATHLRQILVNLMGNAVKYTHQGTVSVRAKLVDETPPALRPSASARWTGAAWPSPARWTGAAPAATRWIALQVADTGIGIAQTDQQRIFEEFEQVNAGSRGDSMRRGTGLGLPISRRLARLIGGDITLESELGRGSSFTLWLPVDPADLAAAPEVAP